MTYTDQERAAFERVRAELLQNLPNVRQHSSIAPGGVHVFYLTTCKSNVLWYNIINKSTAER